MKRKWFAIPAVLVGLVALAACSAVSTAADQEALHYNGGHYSSKTFSNCVPASTHKTNGPGDKYYIYPLNQRSYDATGAPEVSERGPFTATTKDPQEIYIPLTVTFELNPDCQTLRKFHEIIGNKYQAWWGGSDFVDTDENKNNVPDGWEHLLNFVFGNALQNEVSAAASGYDWRTLWNDPKTRVEIQNQIQAALPALVEKNAGAPAGMTFFQNITVTVLHPDIPAALKANVQAQQAAVAKADSTKAQADAEAKAAQAQIAVANAQAASIAAEVKVLGPNGYVTKYAIDHGVDPYPNPVVAGSGGK